MRCNTRSISGISGRLSCFRHPLAAARSRGIEEQFVDFLEQEDGAVAGLGRYSIPVSKR